MGEWETQLLLRIHAHSSPSLDVLFILSHALGTVPVCGAIVLVAAAWHFRRGERTEAWLWILLGLTTIALQETLKPGVGRVRPQLWPWFIPHRSLSFPSGHAIASATFYPLLARWVVRHRACPSLLAYALAAIVALYVGFGRLYLGVHWPSDVLAGWLMGAAQLAVGIRLADRSQASSSSVPPVGTA